jgi:hypothetical protein
VDLVPIEGLSGADPGFGERRAPGASIFLLKFHGNFKDFLQSKNVHGQFQRFFANVCTCNCQHSQENMPDACI